MTDQLAEVIAGSTIPAAVAAAAAVAGAWLTSRSTKRKVEEVRQLAAPTDAQWADRIELLLADIRSDVRQLRDQHTEHLRDHATQGRRSWH